MICADCMMEVDGRLVCKSCVQQMASQAASGANGAAKRKEPILALLLTFLVTGLGQIYNGQVKKGIIILVGQIIMGMIVVFLMFFLIGCCIAPFLTLLWLYWMYDAYVTAERINRGEVVKDWLD